MAIQKTLYTDLPNLKVDLPDDVWIRIGDGSTKLLETAGQGVRREAEYELSLVTSPGVEVRVVSDDPSVLTIRMRGVPAANLQDALRRRLLPDALPTPTPDPKTSPDPGREIEVLRLPGTDRILAMMPEGDVLYVLTVSTDAELIDGVVHLPAPADGEGSPPTLPSVPGRSIAPTLHP